MRKLFTSITICIVISAAFTSCTKELAVDNPTKKVETPKVDTTPKPKVDTLNVCFIPFMEAYVEKSFFDTSSIFKWITTNVVVNGKPMPYYWKDLDLSYSYNHAFYPSTYYPRFYQIFPEAPRSWAYTIGTPPGTDCGYGITQDFVVELTVITSTGKTFSWKKCPLTLYIQGGTQNQVLSENQKPKTMVIYAQAKNNNNGLRPTAQIMSPSIRKVLLQ
jgi:hypothetical protein